MLTESNQPPEGIMTWKCFCISDLGLQLDISEMDSWMHTGCTANILIKDIIHISASICKNMQILLMGWHYCEHWWPFMRGIQSWPVVSPHKRPVMCIFSVLLAWSSYWTNSQFASDLGCHGVSNNVTGMHYLWSTWNNTNLLCFMYNSILIHCQFIAGEL